jgi:uncharacterized protein (TIGR03435 family)
MPSQLPGDGEAGEPIRAGCHRQLSVVLTAVREQLGLRLDAQLGPVDALVIDAVQFPTENQAAQ